MTAILFVCLGNICRSPAAEAILRHQATQNFQKLKLNIQSCGLGDWHVGQAPDHRMQRAARQRGIVMQSRAQQFQKKFFDEFDYILAADREILQALQQQAKKESHHNKLHLITQFSAKYYQQDVPDPYYLGVETFEEVLLILEESCKGLLKKINGS